MIWIISWSFIGTLICSSWKTHHFSELLKTDLWLKTMQVLSFKKCVNMVPGLYSNISLLRKIFISTPLQFHKIALEDIWSILFYVFYSDTLFKISLVPNLVSILFDFCLSTIQIYSESNATIIYWLLISF